MQNTQILKKTVAAVGEALLGSEDAPTWPATAVHARVTGAGTATAACWHPRSCARCDRAGVCCGRHHVGDAGHERCTGMHA